MSNQRFTAVQWTVCVIASIGFAFDIYELLMLPLIARHAISELTGFAPGSPGFLRWVGIMFYVPAVAGGIFGLYGGYLTDRLGRRRVLTWSILLYAFSAFFAGFSTSIWMLLFLRCTTFIGVCVEFVAAVAWLAELFPDPKQKEKVLGYTQAFSSIGGLLVAVVNGVLASMFDDPSTVWRYTLMSGLLPALPLLIIRPFLPESPVWAKKRAAGTLKRPSFAELFSPKFRRTTIVTTIMFACSYGAAFGAIQHIPQMVPGLVDVKAKVEHLQDEAIAENPAAANDPKEMRRIAGIVEQKTASNYTKLQEIGGLLGRFTFALLAVVIISRRWLLRVFQWPGLLFVPALFWLFLAVENTHFFTIPLSAIYLGDLPVTTVSLGVMLAGFFTVAQFSFWGNYLPRVYPVHLRGTGESFAANIGGRMIGTAFAAVTTTLAGLMAVSEKATAADFTKAAAIVALFVYLAGSIANFFLPEPGLEEEDDEK